MWTSSILRSNGFKFSFSKIRGVKYAAPCFNFKTNREPRRPKLPTLALMKNYRTRGIRCKLSISHLLRVLVADCGNPSPVDGPTALPNMPPASKWQVQFAAAIRGAGTSCATEIS
jgi:hypothetical protein